VATDADGNVYVADQGNNRVQKFGQPTVVQPATWGHIKALY
jgi:DNA-binding beta-propeller fold protein YncE